MPSKTAAQPDLAARAAAYAARSSGIKRRVVICAGTGCVANGSLAVSEEFVRQAQAVGLELTVELKPESKGIFVSRSGCQGFCQMGPLVTVLPDGIMYTKVVPADVAEIMRETLVAGRTVERLLYVDPSDGARCRGAGEIPFYKKQHRSVLKDCGLIDPEDIDEYIARGGYAPARKAFLEMTPAQICSEMTASGLRGRGGGGFPAGRKWEFTRVEAGPKKYVICNGDEGDPGAFMDRSVMEGNPHSVIEGMLIAARAIGADEGYVYVRTEYPLAVARMRQAIADAEKTGLLGRDVFGTGADFHLQVMEGAGAFVCGEETALMSSIEGRRGMPNPKPPFPAQRGLWEKPTVINNVETLATVPLILAMGAARYAQTGSKGSTGTKNFALTGHVANTGLIEVPFGTTLREVVFGIAGGVTADDGTLDPEGFKAVQIGGPSGGCLTAEHLDLPLDFDSLKSIGAMVGSGGLVVMNKDTCMVEVARYFMQFTQNESCGKCVLCREGTRQMLALLDDIITGRATRDTLSLLKTLALTVQKGSLCGLGKTAPNPVLSTLRYFKAEYDSHVEAKCCPAGRCKALVKYSIEPSLCKGCTLCAKKCPARAISGELRRPHAIDHALCIKCGACVTACKFKAVQGGKP
jgi:NADH-quinone oxidoreductase subunit F